MLTQLLTKLLYNLAKVSYYWVTYYKEKFEITKSIYNFSFFQLTCKKILLSGNLCDYIGKFLNYYLHYKEISKMTKYIYNFFFSGHLFSFHYYLVIYLTILANFVIIIQIIKTNLLMIQPKLLFVLQIIFIFYLNLVISQ